MFDPRTLFSAGPPAAEECAIDLPVDVMEVAEALSHRDGFAFLDGADTLGPQGSYSVLAYDPKLVFESKGDRIRIRYGKTRLEASGNPFDVLAGLLDACVSRNHQRPPVPFLGGAIGYFGYDLFPFLERYDRIAAVDDLCLPDCVLAFYDSALVFMNSEKRWHVTGTSLFHDAREIGPLLERKRDEIRSLVEQAGAERRAGGRTGAGRKEFRSNFPHDSYIRAIEKALEHIYAGDIYQVNLSQRFQTDMTGTPFELFRTLRSLNPSQYGAFLPYEAHALVSSSPELFLTTSGRTVETRPIKGTRPRGSSPEEDEKRKRELLSSAKDRAELSMIVDLERNDLGRVCEYGSVRVEQHGYIDELPTVFHTVSTVRGELRDRVGPVDLLRATFPGGSISGCPKIRSIQIIDELEPTRRNAYTGSAGFIDAGGDLTLNILIRTMTVKGDQVYFQAGGGIVSDSDPEAEYAETLDKAKAMMDAADGGDER